MSQNTRKTKAQLVEENNFLRQRVRELEQGSPCQEDSKNFDPGHSYTISQQLTAAVDALSESVILCDADDRIIFCNKVFQEHNRPVVEYLKPGTPYKSFLCAIVDAGLVPCARGREEQWLCERLEQRRNPKGPFVLLRQDNLWLLMHEQRLASGGTMLIATDISELRQAEQAAKDAQTLLVDAIGAMAEGFALYDSEERLVMCNKPYRDTLPLLDALSVLTPGAKMEDILRAGVKSGFVPSTYASDKDYLTKRLERFRHPSGRFEFQTTNGQWISVEERKISNGGTVSIRTDITERKNAEIALKASEARLRSIIDNYPELITLKDLDGRYILVNRAYAKNRHISVEQASGKSVRDIEIPERARVTELHDQEVMEKRETVSRERERLLPDGSRKVLSVIKFPAYGDKGDLIGVGTISTDVTDRRHAEEATRQSEADFREAVEAIDAGFAMFDEEDRMMFCNGRNHELFPTLSKAGLLKQGVKFEEIVRNGAESGRIPEAKNRVEEYIRERVGKHRMSSNPIEYMQSYGRSIRTEERRTRSGKYVTIHTDITQRKKAEHEISEKTVLLQNILDATPAFISLRDTKGRFVFVNDLLGTEMNMPPDKIVGNSPTDLYGAVSGDTVEALVNEVIKSKQPVFGREIKSARRVGRYFNYSAVPMFGDGGEISNVLAVGQDITQKNQMERELVQKTALFQMILDAMPALISYRNTVGQFAFVNKNMASHIGVQPSDAIGKTRADLHGEVPGNTVQNLAMKVLKTKQPILEQELQLARRPGQTYRYSVVPIFEDNEDVSGVLSIGQDITELKSKELEIAKNSILLQTILDTTPISLSLRDMEGRFIFMNKQLGKEIRGLPEDYIGKTASEVRGEVRGESVENLVKEVLKTKRPIIDREYNLAMRPGRTHRYSAIPVFESNGEMSSVLAIGQDVSEQMQSEADVRQSEARLRAIIDNAPVAISLKGLDDNLQLANKAFLKRFDVTSQNLANELGKTVLLEEHAKIRAAQEKIVLETGEPVTQERFDVLPSGDVFPRITTKFPIKSEEGEIVGVGSISMDMSELRKVEKSLHVLEERLSDILRIAPEVIISTNDVGEIMMFNDAAEHTFGYKRDEVISQSLDVLLPEGVRDVHSGYLQAFIEGSDTQRLMSGRGEISGRRRDGSYFPAEASISKLISGGEIILTVTMHDTTERKRVEEVLRLALVDAERANKAKSEFLATMSHELRTPLNAVIGFSEILAGQFFGPIGSDKYIGYADNIKNSGEHLLLLINDILDLSAIESGKYELHKKILNFQEVLEECVPIVNERANETQIAYVSDVSPDLPPVKADRRAVKQMLLNLLSNAIKFTPKGGKVTLTATASTNAMTIEICDTGTGIPNEKLATLTDPFVRGETDPYKSQEGTGLGLAIVKSLVDLHDGGLTIESEVGVGTVVTVTMPLGGA